MCSLIVGGGHGTTGTSKVSVINSDSISVERYFVSATSSKVIVGGTL